MGFKLVNRVYENVSGTSAKAQAVLAYLAHRADDNGAWTCHPNLASIEAATHFGHTAVCAALNELRELNLLQWKTGGRMKGRGGRALANEYLFNIPEKPTTDGVRKPETVVENVVKTRPSIPQRPDSADTEAGTAELKSEFAHLAENWSATASSVREKLDIRERTQSGVLEEAMSAAGVSDAGNRQIFASTLLRRNPEDCLEIIWEFAKRRKTDPTFKPQNPAALLNRMLSKMPPAF